MSRLLIATKTATYLDFLDKLKNCCMFYFGPFQVDVNHTGLQGVYIYNMQIISYYEISDLKCSKSLSALQTLQHSFTFSTMYLGGPCVLLC